MKFLSLEPFVPSGKNFKGAKQLFQELGFEVNWDGGDYIGFERDGCKFVLQKFDNRDFAENFMISIRVNDVRELWTEINKRELVQKFGVRVGEPAQQPYGLEVTLIDMAGVCWHFVE